MAAHRTTFSLDERTIDALKRLSAHWKISQAGVVRRIVQAADQQTLVRITPQQAIEQFRSGAVTMSEASLKSLVEDARLDRLAADQNRH